MIGKLQAQMPRWHRHRHPPLAICQNKSKRWNLANFFRKHIWISGNNVV